jgi:phosphatidylinositol dimannoside acyltransferase
MNFKYWGLCLAASVARIIPLSTGYWLAERGGDVFYLFSTRRRRMVGNNIRRAMGLTENERIPRGRVRYVFRNAAKNYFDLTKLSFIDKENLDGKVKIEGIQHLKEAVERGKGVIIATAHLGNFEFSAHVVAALGYDMTILIEAYDDSAPFLRKLAALRRGQGIRILPVDLLGVKECLKTLQRGGTVTIVCDRDLQGNGIKTPFFGKETSFPVGVVDLAQRTGAAVIPIFSLRGPKNTSTIFVEPPLKLVNSQNREQDLKANLTVLVSVLEKYIRSCPEQWVVLEPV